MKFILGLNPYHHCKKLCFEPPLKHFQWLTTFLKVVVANKILKSYFQNSNQRWVEDGSTKVNEDTVKLIFSYYNKYYFCLFPM